MKKETVKNFVELLVLLIVFIGPVVMCKKPDIEDSDAPENKEQIRTQQEDDRDSIPPGHHPDNDDDDPYGGKYDPIWFH